MGSGCSPGSVGVTRRGPGGVFDFLQRYWRRILVARAGNRSLQRFNPEPFKRKLPTHTGVTVSGWLVAALGRILPHLRQ